MIEASRMLASIPDPLRQTLLETYQQIASHYMEGRWAYSELNGGKFCEAVYSIINGALTGSYPAMATKPRDMVAACRSLEQLSPNSARVGDRSMRILIPRQLLALYEIRNNRGVGHVGGDVDANHMDAEAVRSTASWIMAELVRIFHNVTTTEAQEIVDALVERKTPAIWEIGGLKRVLDPDTPIRDQVLLLLHHSAGWVPATDLCRWVEYSNVTVFRRAVLTDLHDERLIEFDKVKGQARISPRGAAAVEKRGRAA